MDKIKLVPAGGVVIKLKRGASRRLIKIVYGTGGGNTELVCETVAEVLSERGFEVELLQAKVTEPATVLDCELLILASPTYGHGLLEQYFGGFLAKLTGVELKGRRCAIIGLGDPKYDNDYHIESARIIMLFLKKKGAEIVGLPLRVSKCPLPLIDNLIRPWAEKLAGMA